MCRRNKLAGLVIILLLAIVGLFIAKIVHHKNRHSHTPHTLVPKLDYTPVAKGAFQNALNHWQVDKAWLEKAKKLMAGKDLVSIDIFDTCLTRDVERPVDIFAIVEQKLLEKGFKASGFAKRRREAENASRQVQFTKNHSFEVNLDDIYAQFLQQNSYSDACLKQAKEIEYATECSHLYAVPDLLALVTYLKGQHIPFCIVSDMYLPSAFLQQVMQKKGFSGWDNFIVSCAVGKSKWGKDIWSLPYFQGRKILHIGDNVQSDVVFPKGFGIETLHYARAMSKIPFDADLNAGCVNASENYRLQEMKSRAKPE